MASALLFPGILAAAGRNPHVRWPATRVALVYMVFFELMGLVLPLFSAEPKLAPILNRVTHMVPPMFPLLLAVPALGMDAVLQWGGRGRGWRRDLLLAIGCGVAFVAIFTPVQWHFSEFLLGASADNAFFHGHGRYFGYGASMGPFRFEHWLKRDPVVDVASWIRATGVASASAWVGILFGNFLAKVRR